MVLNYRKSIGSIVATALLIVVAVLGVISFQIWFIPYSNVISNNIENKTNNELKLDNISIELLLENKLYIKNNLKNNLTVDFLEIGNKNCNISVNLSFGVNEIDVTDCITNIKTQTPDVVLIIDNIILQKQFYFKLPQCDVLDGIKLNSGENYSFSNSSYGFSTCYYQERFCRGKVLNGSNDFNFAQCTSYYDLSCLTDDDNDGFINSSCAIYPVGNTNLSGHFDVNDENNIVKPNLDCIFNGFKNSTQCLNNYIINGCGAGTVLDISTNLCWQRDLSSAGTLSWANAINYCNNLDLSGVGWRLPNPEELLTLTDISRFNPAIVGGNNNIFQNVLNDKAYWVKSTYILNTDYAYSIVFGTGQLRTFYKYDLDYVVCVKNG